MIVYLLPCLNIFITACSSSQQANQMSGVDRQHVLQTMKNLREAWLRNDTAAIMDFISPDMILYMPNTQGKSKVGKDSVRAFWFPSSNVSYQITEYEVKNEQLQSDDQFSIYSGVSKLSWHILKGTHRSDSTTIISEFINILRKENGQWKLFRIMYNVKDSAYFPW